MSEEKRQQQTPIHQDGSGSSSSFVRNRIFLLFFVFSSAAFGWHATFHSSIYCVFTGCGSWNAILTWFDRSVNVSPRFVVDPVESSLDGQTCQHAVFGTVAIRCRNVDAPSFVVQRVGSVQAFLVPAFRHAQFHARPLVHHRNGQRVQLLFAAL